MWLILFCMISKKRYNYHRTYLSQEMRSRTQMQRELLSLIIKQNKEQQKPPRRGKTSRQAEDWSTVKHELTWHSTHERQRISTGLQTQGDYIGRQTRVTRETQLEPLKQWLSNKMGGDRQSTWEHMAPNKQQAMCSTDRDIWWPAWAHQQDRDITPPLRSGSQTLHTH